MDETNELLICDEVWDMMSPVASFDSPHDHAHQNNDWVDKLIHTTTNQDCKRTFDTYLRKEIKYMTTPGYINFLESNKFVSGCRCKVIQWFIHEGLEYCFEARLIQKMEFKILECLNWEVNSTTPQSYVELISWKLGSIMNPFAVDELSSSLNNILLSSLLARSRRLTRAQFIQENLESCNEIIQQIGVTSTKPHAKGDPSSPDTVLTKEQVAIYEDQVDLSFIHGRAVSNKLKRKRKDDYNVKNKQIKCVH
ncbi:putative cyclin-D7-1 [Tanacetum coccineum]